MCVWRLGAIADFCALHLPFFPLLVVFLKKIQINLAFMTWKWKWEVWQQSTRVGNVEVPLRPPLWARHRPKKILNSNLSGKEPKVRVDSSWLFGAGPRNRLNSSLKLWMNRGYWKIIPIQKLCLSKASGSLLWVIFILLPRQKFVLILTRRDLTRIFLKFVFVYKNFWLAAIWRIYLLNFILFP